MFWARRSTIAIPFEQSFGYLDQDNHSGPQNGPERYIGFSGLSPSSGDDYSSYTSTTSPSGDNVLGNYLVYVYKAWGGDIAWKLTATDGDGNSLLYAEGEFGGSCGDKTSQVYNVGLFDYIDNGCTNADMAALPAIEGRDDRKA